MSEFERTKFVFCTYEQIHWIQFRSRISPKTKCETNNFIFGEAQFRTSQEKRAKLKLCPLGEIVLKAKIVFQKVLGEIHFTQDLVWVKLARRNAHTKHEFPAKHKARHEIARAAGRIHPISGSISEITNSV